MKNKFGILMILIPVLLFFSDGWYVYLKSQSNDELLAQGKCIETFTEEHWHKHSPPSVTVHSTVRLGHDAYVLDGDCNNKLKEIPWTESHEVHYAIGVISCIIQIIIGVMLVLVIIVVWVIIALSMIKGDKNKSFTENLNAFLHTK